MSRDPRPGPPPRGRENRFPSRLTRWIAVFVAVTGATLAMGQQVARPFHIGVVVSSASMGDLKGPRPAHPAALELVEGLAERGWVDGKNIRITWKSAEGNIDRITALVAELVALPVDILVTSGNRIAVQAQKTTRTIPIVMASGWFPVEAGLVASLARPGANITGLTSLSETGIDGKRLGFLKEIAPKVSRVAVLVTTDLEREMESVVAARMADEARILGLSIILARVGSTREIENVIADAKRRGANGLLVSATGFTYLIHNESEIHRVAAKHQMPAIYSTMSAAESGGLVSYASNEWGQFRRAAYYVDRILKGAKPAELPIEQPAKLRLEVNLKTAKQLGLTIPPSVLAQADKVFE